MPAYLITCEASDGAVTHSRLVAASWHDAWQALRDRRDDADAARIRNRSAGDVTDVEIHTLHQRLRIQSDPHVAARTTEALPTIAPPDAADRAIARPARAAGAATVRIPEPPTGSSEATDALIIRIHGRSPELTRRTPQQPLTPSGFDETMPALTSETFQGLSNWSGREPATAATVRPVARARRRPDTTEESLPAPRAGPPGLRERPTVPDGAAASPSTFTPMADFGFALPASRQGGQRPPVAAGAVLQWAIDTVAHQVPARLVLGLEVGPQVVTIWQARGEGDRALRGARAGLDQWPAALDLSQSSRLRLAGEPLVTWWRDQAGVRHALEVRAAMWTTLEDAATPTRSTGRLALLVIDPPRSSGFTEGELSALGYLARMVAPRLG